MATGDITSVTVRSDGWSADVVVEGFTTGATYAYGLGANNADTANAKVKFTVTSLGFDATGTATTVVREVYGTKTVRKPHPDHATLDETGGGNLSFRMALSEPIFAKDNTGAGNSGVAPTVTFTAAAVTNAGGGAQTSNAVTALAVTNNSTLAYPKAVARWAWPGYERVTSEWLLEVIGFHPYGRDGRPFACVKFDATDGTTPLSTVTETTMAATTRTGDANTIPVFSTTVSTTGFAQDAQLTAQFQAYPWVGDTASVCDSRTTADGNAGISENLTPLYAWCDKSDALALYASVDGVGGGTPTVSSSKATARANPYSTIALALAALKTAGTTADHCVVLLQNGTYTGTTTFTGSNAESWTIVQADTENGATEAGCVISTAANQAHSGWIKYENVTFSGAGVGLLVGHATNGRLWLDSCSISQTSSSFQYQWRCCYATRNTITAIGVNGLTFFSSNKSPWALTRGNDASAVTAGARAMAYCCVGNRGLVHFLTSFPATGNGQGHAVPVLAIVAYNSTYANAGTTFQLSYVDATINGFAVVCNLFERISNSQAVSQINADAGVASGDNVYIAHNTMAGERLNANYNDTGTTAVVRSNWFHLFNALNSHNIKTDTFATANGARVGNWADLHGVGSRGNRYEISSFPRDFAGIDVALTTEGGMGWTDDKSFTTAGVGVGDYTLTEASPARNLIPAGMAALPFDLAGVTYDNTGAGSAGAFQRAADLAVGASTSKLAGGTGVADGTLAGGTGLG